MGRDDRPKIHFDLPKLERFRAAERLARSAYFGEFTFEGQHYDVEYAKLLIQFLERKLER